ncbi:MAG TPA: VIT domain-containing protein [Polyangiaceae bacterium]|nr:VIT domain-containing protein [Polyangiaceae bacterium]
MTSSTPPPDHPDERPAKLKALHGLAVGKTCLALLGSQPEAEQALTETIESALDDDDVTVAELERAELLRLARRCCARRLETRGRPDAKTTPSRAERLLGELRPTEREALVLRYVAELNTADLAEACEADEDAVQSRVARALLRLREEEVEAPRELCERVAEAMPALLEGKAAAPLVEHARDCDHCRDARHDAERAIRQLQALANDFVLRVEVPATAPPAPEPATAPVRRTAGRAGALAKRWAAPLLALAAAAAVVAGRSHSTGTSADDPELVGPPWRGKVKKLLSHDGKLELCAPGGGACHALRPGDDVPAGSVLKTDRSTLAELAFTDESVVSLDRGTTLRLSTRGRGGELVQGGLVADIAHRENWSARFEFKSGHLDVLGTKFSLRSDNDSASVHVARGSVQLADGSGHDVVVLAGEEGRVDVGAAPVTSPATSLGEALGWSEAVQSENEGENEPEARPRALGELKAQKPGERTERAGAVRLDSHQVRVKIAGGLARTEVEEVFTNQTDDVLEGIFRFPLPPDAKIERLALEVDGKLEEGAFVDRERASAIWRGAIVNAAPQLRQEIKDEIVWVPGPWRDPALLEWQRGGRFELRIFPIPKRGSRRVVLAYSQLVPQSAGLRHYSYPLGFDPSGNATPLDFSVDVQLRGIDPQTRIRTPGWEVSRERDDGAERLRFDARSFVPNGDFSVDYALTERDSELSAWAYRDAGAMAGAHADAGQPYVALALRPKLPKRVSGGQLQAVALVVDASRSVYGENYRRATALAARLARDLDTTCRVTVLACDTTCREMPGEPRVPGAQAARDVRRFLEHEVPEGASDVTLAVARGFQAIADNGRQPHVIYIGDGVATAGPTRSSTIERAVRATLPANGRVTSLGIGPESDAESLLALARGGAGTALPYVPGQPLADAAFAAISAVYGAALSDVRLDLPEGITQVSPARFDPISAGSELIVTGRLDDANVKGDVVLRGTVDGRPFEQRYRLDVTASDSSGNAFVPRLFAAGRIADLEPDGSDGAKREAVALSTKHGVASRYTSLLVLESEAMYKAFGLDTARKTPDYTADLEAEGASASGELAVNEADDAAPNKDEAQGRVALGATAPEEKRADKSASRAPLSLNPYDFDGRSGAGASAGAPRGPSPAPKPASARKPASVTPSPGYAPAPAASAAPEPETISEQMHRAAAGKKRVLVEGGDVLEQLENRPRPEPRPRQWIPMRRIWERKGAIFTDRFVPQAASGSALSDAERALLRDDTRRQNLKRTFALSSAAGDLGEAARLAERWLEKEPLDPEAITALADVEARRGHRELSIRMLGSVLDVRPGDTASHKRLARLERWAGHADLACRHSIAIAENKGHDLDLVSEAVRCARETGMTEIADALLAATADSDRSALEQRLTQRPVDAGLRGDVQLEATWHGDLDLDLSLLDTDGHRVSWLGAATRSVITANDATSTSHEELALRGAAPGEYVVELTRGAGAGDAQGELVITIAGTSRRVPFHFDGDRKTVALVRVTMQPRLVPL